MPTAELPDDWNDYYKEKGRDLPQHKADPVSDLLQELDNATISMLHHGGSKIRVDQAFEAVLNHPESTWKRDVLLYRQRVTHYS
jgi:hypothetical protein